jgi:hypothetical protein
MKMIRLIFTVFVFLFISASAIMAQSNEQKVIPTEGGKYVSCGHDDHGQECGSWTFVPDLPEVDPNVQASPAGPMGGCTPRPYRQLVAYDDQLLVNYTHQQIVDLVMIAHKRFSDAMDSSGIIHAGVRILDIIPWKMPAYATIFELQNWLNLLNDGILDSLTTIKNELWDADHLLVITRSGISASTGGRGVNLQVINTPGADPETLRQFVWQKNTGVVNFVTFGPNLGITFAHETGHGLGGGHESESWSPTYARAYVNTTKQVNCFMKSSSVVSNTYNRFSGPNSKIIKNGETIVMCEDTAVQNNAKHISECLEQFWCATEKHITRVSLPSTNCGSGKLQAITNNADTFLWKVLSGNCVINGSGQEISYMAMSTSKIQVIAQKQGKWYADTAVIEIPALQTFPTQMQKCIGTSITLPDGTPYTVSKDTTMEYMLQGSKCDSFVILSIKALPTSTSSQKVEVKAGQSYTLPDGKVVNMSGTYISKLTNTWGCDSTITTIFTVLTATVDLKELGIAVFPNPVQDMLTFDGLLSNDQVLLQDQLGRFLPLTIQNANLDCSYLLPGVYFLTIQRADARGTTKVLKW